MSGDFFRVSGIDPNDGASIVFVWCRTEGEDARILVGSGHVVVAGEGLPPGIQAGQYSVVFMLPADCLAESIVVTDNKKGNDALTNVCITPCSPRTGRSPLAISASDRPAARALSANGYHQP